jgi:hypothetical protein
LNPGFFLQLAHGGEPVSGGFVAASPIEVCVIHAPAREHKCAAHERDLVIPAH